MPRIAQKDAQCASNRPERRVFSNIDGSTPKDRYSLPFRMGNELAQQPALTYTSLAADEYRNSPSAACVLESGYEKIELLVPPYKRQRRVKNHHIISITVG